MGWNVLETLLHPYETPGIGKYLEKLDPLGAKADKIVRKQLDPKLVDTSGQSYVNPFTGQVVKYRRGGKVNRFGDGGKVDDLTPRSNLPDKNAKQQAEEAKKKDAKREKYNDLAPRENLPPKKYAKGGSVRGDGCCAKGMTKGKFR